MPTDSDSNPKQPLVRPVYIPSPYQEGPAYGRIILRDGSTAKVHQAQQADIAAVRSFYRAFALQKPVRFAARYASEDEFLQSLCDPSDPARHLTLLISRELRGTVRIVALGAYWRMGTDCAESLFLVDEAFRRKGISTLLLERLAMVAIQHDIARFSAQVHASNQPMLDVFRHSGFQLQERLDGSTVEIALSLTPNQASVEHHEVVDRLFTAASLRPLLKPRSVAVVGASRKPLSIGYRILEGLVRNNFAGPIYPVNPAAEELLGRRVYARVDEIADAVDLAVIVVPSKRVMEVVDQCALKQVRALVVISAGFAEVGEEGRALQRQLAEKVRLGGMRMVGPNCLGVLNTHPAVRMNASFAPVFPPAGGVAMLSQSGALGIAVLALAGQKHMGMSSFVSVGNKADVSGNDLLQYWEQDPDTKVILLYLESFGNPRRFARVARRVSLSKPVIAVKGGRTSAGKRAAGSHTAALAASDVAVDALFEQTGVIRVNTLAEMFDLSVVLAEQSLPKGNRVAIVTNAGGPGILCADACETSGLAVPQLSEAVRRKLASYLPPEAGMVNPVDMIAGATPENYSRAVGDILQSDDVDALIALYVPVGVTNTPEIAEGIAAGVRQVRAAGIRKPILACLMDTAGHGASLRVDQERIPTHTFPEEAARSLGKAVEYAQWRQRPQGVVLDFIDTDVEQARAVVQRELAQHGEGWLSTPGAWEVLRAVGLPVAKGGIASSAQGAAAIARAIGFPVVVKLASQKIVHKTEHGAVVLNLKDEAAVVRAFEAIQQRLVQAGQADAMDGVLVQPMLSGGIEVMVGMFEDPSFGPLIAFGLGGVHVEILRDVSFRITPLTDLDAEHMIRDIKGAQLFEGYRGHAPADTDALKELLLRISLLVEAVPEIAELDLNPVFALEPGKGCHIVDVRIRVKAPNKQGASRYSHLMTG